MAAQTRNSQASNLDSSIQLSVQPEVTLGTNPKPSCAMSMIDSKLIDELNVGQIVSGYKLMRQIGRGGMGIVFLAEYLPLGRTCALKFLAPSVVSARSWVMFQKEARLVAALSHPMFCPVYDMGIHKGLVPFYSMEHISGLTLEQLLHEKRELPVDAILKLLIKLADGLHYAHSQGIVHKDIKPANIMLMPLDRGKFALDSDRPGKHARCWFASFRFAVKILDFGIAELCDRTSRQFDKPFTQNMLGTYAYMSPERFDGKRLDGRCDIYSLGCTAFEALTGEPPYAEDNWLKLVWHHKNSPVPLLRERSRVRFPLELEAIIRKMLAKNPEWRYKTADQLSRDLQCIVHGEPLIFAEQELAQVKDEVLSVGGKKTGFAPLGGTYAGADSSRRNMIRWLGLSALACSLILAVLVAGVALSSGDAQFLSFSRYPSVAPGAVADSPMRPSAGAKRVSPRFSVARKGDTLSDAEVGELGRRAASAFQAEKYSQTVELTTDAIRNGGKGSHLYCLRAASFFHLGMPQQALSDFKRALNAEPGLSEQPMALEMTAMCHADLGQLNEALSEANKSVRIRPTCSSLKLKGQILSRLKRYGESVAAFSEGLRLNPRDYWLLLERAKAYTELKEYDLAIKDYNQMIEIRADGAIAYQQRAQICELLGKTRQAQSDRIKAKALSARTFF